MRVILDDNSHESKIVYLHKTNSADVVWSPIDKYNIKTLLREYGSIVLDEFDSKYTTLVVVKDERDLETVRKCYEAFINQTRSRTSDLYLCTHESLVRLDPHERGDAHDEPACSSGEPAAPRAKPYASVVDIRPDYSQGARSRSDVVNAGVSSSPERNGSLTSLVRTTLEKKRKDRKFRYLAYLENNLKLLEGDYDDIRCNGALCRCGNPECVRRVDTHRLKKVKKLLYLQRCFKEAYRNKQKENASTKAKQRRRPSRKATYG